MDFFASLIFLVLYYLRPQEWISLVAVLRPVTLTIALALVATLTRDRRLTAREVFRTPHDWLVAGYFLWIVVTSGARWSTFQDTYKLLLFYFLTTLALSSVVRLQRYLLCWTALLVALATLGVASLFGLDPTDAAYMTNSVMEGRLSLGSGMFANPNALGHAVVPALILLYYLFVWKRPAPLAVMASPLFLLSAYCLYLTKSKGAYMSAGLATIVALCFGRSRVVQMWILLGSVALGALTISSLPRMSAMDNPRKDMGIRRRVSAFRFGYAAMHQNLTGLGYGHFDEKIQETDKLYWTTPSSSYVRAGAEFGFIGLMLFCGTLYAGYRTLITARTGNREEESVRRMLFVLLFSFTLSSWMMDWSLNTYFVLVMASIGAFQRLLLDKASVPGLSSLAAADRGGRETMAMDSGAERPPSVKAPGIRVWNRFRLPDYAMMLGVTLLATGFWRYVMLKL